MLSDAKQKYDANDRMGALYLWEQALKKDEADNSQRVAALYNATCVHAGFGDVELAQITLREAVQRGLEFSKAIQDPEALDPSLVKFVASQQVLVRLKKFDEATRKAMGAAAAPPSFNSSGSSQSRPRRNKPSVLDNDLSKMLETDMQGIDTAVFGIIRRVAVLLAVLTAMGVSLYLVGIKYLFPDM